MTKGFVLPPGVEPAPVSVELAKEESTAEVAAIKHKKKVKVKKVVKKADVSPAANSA